MTMYSYCDGRSLMKSFLSSGMGGGCMPTTPQIQVGGYYEDQRNHQRDIRSYALVPAFMRARG